MFRVLLLSVLLLIGRAVQAAPLTAEFASIDGGVLSLEAWRGQPVLVVNTASQCGFTGQYADLQKMHETYGKRGLVVLAVPSDSFNQELETASEVKAFCEMNYGLTLTDGRYHSGQGAKGAFVLQGRCGANRFCAAMELQQNPVGFRR